MVSAPECLGYSYLYTCELGHPNRFGLRNRKFFYRVGVITGTGRTKTITADKKCAIFVLPLNDQIAASTSGAVFYERFAVFEPPLLFSCHCSHATSYSACLCHRGTLARSRRAKSRGEMIVKRRHLHDSPKFTVTFSCGLRLSLCKTTPRG